MLFWTFFQTSGGGKSSQEMIEELASDILTKIPADFNLEECQVSTSYLSTMSTMCTSSYFSITRSNYGINEKSQNPTNPNKI